MPDAGKIRVAWCLLTQSWHLNRDRIRGFLGKATMLRSTQSSLPGTVDRCQGDFFRTRQVQGSISNKSLIITRVLIKKFLLFFTSLRKSPSPETSEFPDASHPLSPESMALIPGSEAPQAGWRSHPVRRLSGFGAKWSRTTKGGSLIGPEPKFSLRSRTIFA